MPVYDKDPRALRDDLYSIAVESSSDPIFMLDENGVFVYANHAAATAMGMTPAELVGKQMHQVFPKQAADRQLNSMLGVFRTGEGFLGEERPTHTRYGLRWYNTNLEPVKDAGGRVRHVVGISRDITERKLASEALLASQDSYRRLFDQSADGVAVIVDGRIVRANPALCEIVALPARELIGRRVEELASPDDAGRLTARLRALQQGTEGADLSDYDVKRPDGSVRHAQASSRPVVWDGRRAVQLLLRDLTERKRLEERLFEAEKLEAIGRLAGGVAHDFNNLLTVIEGNARLLEMDCPGDSGRAGLVAEIVKAADRAAALTRQLLGFARRGKLHAEPVDLHGTVRRVVSLLDRSIDKRIDIALDLRARSAVITGDAAQLESALLNLALNARDAMPEGGQIAFRTREVAVGRGDSGDGAEHVAPGTYLELSVHDTGVGMSAEVQGRIFEPFFTTKDVGKGSGLGLAGVYGCVKSHNGSIRFDSAPGEGTTFRILLPLAASPPARDEAGDAAPEPPRTGNGTILLVDDEESIRTLGRRVLGALGYTAMTAADGVEAVETYRRHARRIDLVILDLIMPRVHGRDIIRRLRHINPQVRVLLSSGYSDPQTVRTALDEGALGFLPKPFDVADLSRALAEHLPAGTS